MSCIYIVYKTFNVVYSFYRKNIPTACSPLGGLPHTRKNKKQKKPGRIALTNREETSLLPLFPTIIEIKTNPTYTAITRPRQERNYGNLLVAAGSIVLSKTGRKYENMHNLNRNEMKCIKQNFKKGSWYYPVTYFPSQTEENYRLLTHKNSKQHIAHVIRLWSMA